MALGAEQEMSNMCHPDYRLACALMSIHVEETRSTSKGLGLWWPTPERPGWTSRLLGQVGHGLVTLGRWFERRSLPQISM